MVVQAFRVVLLLILLSANAFTWEGKDYYTWFGTTDEQIKLGWYCASCFTDETYELELFNIERNSVVITASTPLYELTVSLPFSGHYISRIRTIRPTTEAVCLERDGNSYRNGMCYTEWVESIDPNHSTVDGNPRGWWVYGYIAPPGPPVIE